MCTTELKCPVALSIPLLGKFLKALELIQVTGMMKMVVILTVQKITEVEFDIPTVVVMKSYVFWD
jgi:hypothetical protein